MFFRRKTKENHAKSVQNVRKLLFSLGKTKEKQKTCFFVGKPKENHQVSCRFPADIGVEPGSKKGKSRQIRPKRKETAVFPGINQGKANNMFFRRKTKENHAKSVQNVRNLLFSLGKTMEKQKKKTKKKDPQKNHPCTLLGCGQEAAVKA